MATNQIDYTPPPDAKLNAKLISIPKCAAILGVSRYTIYRMVKDDQLHGVQVGGRRMVSIKSLNELLGAAA
jgi:excisionase family DNA binding protein